MSVDRGRLEGGELVGDSEGLLSSVEVLDVSWESWTGPVSLVEVVDFSQDSWNR